MFLITVFSLILLHSTTSNDDMEIAKSYLLKYGYLITNNQSEVEISQLTESILKFQEYFKLSETGKLNNETIDMMKKPRCGLPDFYQSYVIRSKWTKKHITWKFHRGTQDDEYIASKAFELWDANSGLTFSKKARNPDILIKYGTRTHDMNSHCKGPGKCAFSLDGPGTVLAHTYFPNNDECVEIHVDGDEKWDKTLGSPAFGFTSLFIVLAHEIGHALGLAHSVDTNAIMFSAYSEYDLRNNKLPQDDLNAIQSLYGPQNNSITQTTIKTPLATTQSTTTKTTMRTTRSTTTMKPTTTVQYIENYSKPNLCEVKNKIERVAIINNNIYLLYKGWVWTISLKDKIIHTPLKAIEYLPLGNIDFKKDSIHIYQRPNDEIGLFHLNRLYTLDPNNFGVKQNYDLYRYMSLPRRTKINGVLNSYKGKTYIFYDDNYCSEIDECRLSRKSVKFINEIFPGVPGNFSYVFRYIDGMIYFIKDDMIYEFNEFLNTATGSYKFEIENLLKDY